RVRRRLLSQSSRLMAKLSRTRATSNNAVVRVFLQDSSSATGAGITGLTSASSGLKISLAREMDAVTTNYTVAGSTIESITTLGTYAAPTATKIRFKEIDATNWPGMYELHAAQALLGTGDTSRFLTGLVVGASNLAPCPFEVQLDTNDSSDVYSRIGANGAGLTALGDARIVNLDATVSTRMATFTLPANFASLSITASGLVALSAAGVQSIWDALTSALATVGSIGKLLVTNVDTLISSRTKPADTQAAVTLVATVTNLTNAPTNGDLTATMKTSVTAAVPSAAAIRIEMDSNSTVLAAIQTAVGNISNLSAFANMFGPAVFEIPDSGTVLVPFTIVFKDADGHLVDVDTNAVTLAAINAAGTSRANWSAVTHASTGVYTANYSLASSATKESLHLSATATVSAAARRADFGVLVSDLDVSTSIGTILATMATETNATANKATVLVDTAALLARLTTTRAAHLDYLTAAPPTAADVRTEMDANSSRLASAATEVNATTNKNTVAAAIAAVQSDTDNIQTRLPPALQGGLMPAVIDADAILDALDSLQTGLADTPAALLVAAQASPMHAHVRIIHDVVLDGAGTEADPMRPA
ncbi:MAG: hypothetical protein JWM95_4450, partial [Gemmatimonadetes bacterium]|nr:hypothetical protein [Gemmatimonadota bacterium]